MNNPQGRLVLYLVGVASIFVILFGIRGSRLDYQSDSAGCRDHHHGSAGSQPPGEARHARLAGVGAEHLDGRPAPGAGDRNGFPLDYQVIHRTADLHGERLAASQHRS